MKLPIISRPSRANRGSAQNRSGRKHSRWPRRVASLVVFVPLLVYFIASGIYLSHVYALIQRNLTPIVAGEASRQLHREVRLNRLDLMPLGTVTLEGVKISDGPSFAHGTQALARADRITLHYNFWGLLFDSSNVSHSMGVVSLDNPILRITHLPTNLYNFSDLFKPNPKVQHKPFLGVIQINNGEVIFKDRRAPANHIGVPAVNELAGVNGSVDFTSERHVIFTADGTSVGVRHFSTASVHGGMSRLHSKEYALFIHVNNGNLPYWSTYFKSFPQFHVTGGVGDADVQMVCAGPKSPLDLTGDVDYSNASVVMSDAKILKAPVLGLNGVAHFNNSSVQTHGTFYLYGQRIAASGLLYDFTPAGPFVDFTANASNAGVNSLIAAIPAIKLPPGVAASTVSGQVSFTGALKNPVIDGNIRGPYVTFMGHVATNVASHIHVYNKVFSANKASCTFPNGGTGTANLIVDGSGSTQRVRADGSIRGYDLADLLQAGLVANTAQLTGRGDFDFIADNQTGPMILRSNLRSSNFNVRGLTGLQGAGRITWPNGGEIHVDRFVASGPQGTITAAGSVPVQTSGQDWHLALDASGIDLNLATKPYMATPVQGLASFDGILTGSSSTPDISGHVQVFGGRYGRYSVDSVSGKFNYNGSKLAMSQVAVRRYPTEATVSGDITGLTTTNPSINASVHFARADLQDFSNLVQQYNTPEPKKKIKLPRHVAAQVQDALSTLTGTAGGDLHIDGHFDDPQILGDAVVTDATVGAYRVDRARANFDYRRNQVKVTRGLVSIEGSNITASGTYMAKTGLIAGTFAGSDFDLSRFRRITSPYADVDGTVNFSGSLAGTFKQPTVAIGVVAHKITINRQQVADFSAFANYDDGVINLTGDPWTFTIQRPRTYNSAAGQTTYRIDTFKLALPTVGHPKRPVYLAMNADIPADSPETVKHLIDTLRASSLANTQAVQDIISGYSRIPQPFSGEFSADSIKVDGSLDALNVSTTAHVANLTVGQNQAQSVDVTLDSAVESQRVSNVSVTANQMDVTGLPLDKLVAQGTMTGRKIALNNFTATSNQAFINIQGEADLDGRMQGNLDASGIPLSLFNLYLPKSRALSGELSSLTVAASGPTKAPNLTASITLEKPAFIVRNPDQISTPTQTVVIAQTASTSGKKHVKSRLKAHKAPAVVVAKNVPDNSAQTYSLDRIRSGSITLTSVGDTGERLLTVTNLSAYKGGHPVAVLSGSIPLRWSTGAEPTLDPSTSAPPSAQLTIQDLGAIAALSPGIDPAKTGGSLVATLGPDANSAKGELVGSVVLSNGSLGFLGVSTSLRKVEGSATFNSSKLTIDQLSGVSSDMGTVHLTGDCSLGKNPDLALTLTADKFAINESGNQTFLAKYYGSSFRGKVSGDVKITGPVMSPKISSLQNLPVSVSDVTATMPSPVATDQTEPPTYPFDPSFDVKLAVGDEKNTALITNALIRANTGGNVLVTGTLGAPIMAAHFTIYKGQVIIPTSSIVMKFVRPYGAFTLKYPVDIQDAAGNIQPGLQQQVDINAEAVVYVRRSTLTSYLSVGLGTTTSGGSQIGGPQLVEPSTLDTPVRYTIDAHVHGFMNDPRPDSLLIDLSSNPDDLNKSQMFAALGGYSGLLGPNPDRALSDVANGLLTGVLLPGLLRPWEDSLANVFGFSDFSVDYSNNSPLSVTLTKPLTKRIDITYFQSFGAHNTDLTNTTNVLPIYSVKLSYSLTNRLQLSYSVDDLHDNIAALEGVYSF